jgi:hypothetical protein
VGLDNPTASSSTSTSSLQVNPSGMREGNWLVAAVGSVGGANVVSAASEGWTEIVPQVNQGTTTTGSLWKKRAGPGEAGPYQWNGDNARRMAIIVIAYDGPDPSDLLDPGQASAEGASAQQLDHNSLNPSELRHWHLLATFSNSSSPDDGLVTFDQPPGYNEYAEIASTHATSANVHMALADRELFATAATGVQSVTISGGVNRQLVGLELILRVPVAVAAQPPPGRPGRRPGRWPTAWSWRVGRGRRWEPPPTAAAAEPPVWVPTPVGSRATRPSLPRRGVWFEAPPPTSGPPPAATHTRVLWRGLLRRGRWWTPSPAEPPPAPSPWTPHQVATRATWRPPTRRGHSFQPPWPTTAPPPPPEVPARWLRQAGRPLRPGVRRSRRFDPPWPQVAPAPLELPARWQAQAGRPLRPEAPRGRRFDPPWPTGAPAAPEAPALFRRQRRVVWVCPNRRSGWFDPPWPTTGPPPPRVVARRRPPALHRRGRWHEPPWIPGAVNSGVWQPGFQRHAGPRPRLLPPPRRGSRFDPPWPDTAGQFIGIPPRFIESGGGGLGLVERGGGTSGLVESGTTTVGIVEGSGGV